MMMAGNKGGDLHSCYNIKCKTIVSVHTLTNRFLISYRKGFKVST